MSHELATQVNGKAAMAYVGETPWHGLGQALEEGAGLDVWKKAAGMDFTINRSPVDFQVPMVAAHGSPFDSTQSLRMASRHVLYRSDTHAPLAVVSKDYKIVQPGEVLDFFNTLVNSNGFKLHTAGVLYDGKRLWALAKIGEDAVVMGDDRVGGYLLLSTACDGSMATTARYTTVRVVCDNTLSMALNTHSRKMVKINHSTTFKPADVHDELGIARGEFSQFMTAARALSKARFNNDDMADFTTKVLFSRFDDKKSPVADTVAKIKTSDGFSRITDLFKGSAMGGTLVSAEGTLWGAVNAVTEYVDHHAKARNTNNRLNNAWFGDNDKLKTEALQYALTLV